MAQTKTHLTPYLTFRGNCFDAMAFYKECLGGELFIQTVGESPMADQMPAETHQNVLHSSLTKDGQVLLFASDMMEPGELVNGNAITLCLVCSSKEEIERIFANLSQGGTITSPLKEEFFGTFGTLTDKFGINWMFQFDSNV